MIVALLAVCACACACGTGSGDGTSAPVAVLSAFPAELAPLVEQATINGTVEIEGRVFREGTLGGVPVVLGLTGMGLVNAAAAARAVMDRFELAGVVFSGVAGSPLRIGDVAVPEAWALTDGTTYTVHREWLERIDEIVRSGTVSLASCTLVPVAPSREPVCLPYEPAIVVGGIGLSHDPFGNRPFPCVPDGGDVFGCDVGSEDTALEMGDGRQAIGDLSEADPETPTADDMETAAVAREAAARGLPFIAFRAVSDGAGDPLGLPGFPSEFFVYYRLAASNAASLTVAFLDRLARNADAGRSGE